MPTRRPTPRARTATTAPLSVAPLTALLLLLLLLLTAAPVAAQAPSDDGARAAYAEGLRLAAAGQAEAAIARFDAVITLDTDFPGARRNRGLLRAEAGQTAAAISDLRLACTHDPQDAAALLALGQCYRQTDRPVAAEGAIRQALLLTPDDATAYRSLALALLDQARPEPAVAAAEAATRLAADDPIHWRVLASAHLAAKDPRSAIDALEAARRLTDRVDSALLWSLGQLYLEASMKDEAARQFAAALAAPDAAVSPDRLHAAVIALHGSAPALAARFLELEPDTPRAHRLRAAIARSAGDLPAAIRHAQAAIQRDAADPDTHLLLAQLYLAHGDTDPAIDHARHARAFPAARLRSLHLEADILIRAHRWPAALTALDALAAADTGRDYRELRAQIAELAGAGERAQGSEVRGQ